MRIVSPPIGIYEIHWFNLIPAFCAMRSGENKRNAWLMYLFGVSLLGFNYNWVSESILTFSNLPSIVGLGMRSTLCTRFCHPLLAYWMECALVS